MELRERYGVAPELAWVVTFVVGVAALVVGALVFTQRVFWGFIWQYFWGPVRADANGEACVGYAVEEGTILSRSGELPACSEAALEPQLGTVYLAEPGYTLVSTAGYIAILVFMLAGVYLLIDRFDLRPYPQFFFALVPFMLFGGVLRTVEDAFVAALDDGLTPALEFPVSALLISPLIYFVVFAVTLGALVGSAWLARRGLAQSYHYPLGITGGVVLAGAFGYLVYLGATTEYVTPRYEILAVVVGVATVAAVGAYLAVDRLRPALHAGTGPMGLLVIWGHAIDGAANVVANDWVTRIWGFGEYGPKHPLNRFIMDTTNTLQGGTEIAGTYVGEAWPFFLLKLAVPVVFLAVFDERFMQESPRYAVMLLIAILAVGLGPGTRDMVRITFGI